MKQIRRHRRPAALVAVLAGALLALPAARAAGEETQPRATTAADKEKAKQPDAGTPGQPSAAEKKAPPGQTKPPAPATPAGVHPSFNTVEDIFVLSAGEWVEREAARHAAAPCEGAPR